MSTTTIADENELPGTTSWQLTNPVRPAEREAGTFRSRAIEGYASATSVNVGGTITFHVSTNDPSQAFCLAIYRMGYYGGAGGRLMLEASGLAAANRSTPPESNGLRACDWPVSYTLSVPSDWVSGVYVAKLSAGAAGGGRQSYIIFVVRDDARASRYLFQSSVTTFQAYNRWGGRSTYGYNSSGGAAVRVSFNRPYALAYYAGAWGGAGAGGFFTHDFGDSKSQNLGFEQVCDAGWEYSMVRWIESQGLDVTYCTNIDVHRDPSLLLGHRAFLSVGHDEYWSQEMRLHIEDARDQGVHLAFFSANTCYWQVRFEPSASGEPLRTMVSYKESADPLVETSPYPYPKKSALFQSMGWPEDGLLGSSWHGAQSDADLVVSDVSHWLFRGTGLQNGSVVQGLVGYEFNLVTGEARVPEGLSVLAHSRVNYPDSYNLTYTVRNDGSQRHPSWADVTVYTAESGAYVFSAGTIQWSWALDAFQVPVPAGAPSQVQPRMTREARLSPGIAAATRNLLDRCARSSDGEGEFYDFNGSSMVGVSGNLQGWRSTWLAVVPGDFLTGRAGRCLLFHDGVSGELFLYETGSAGLVGPAVAAAVLLGGSALRRPWRAIVPGSFFNNPGLTDLALYDAIAGEVFLCRNNGDGTFTAHGPRSVGPNRWRAVIPGRFTPGAAFTELLCYDPRGSATNGLGRIYRTDGQGALSQHWQDGGWRSTWRSLVAGRFMIGWASSGCDDLLLHDATSSELWAWNHVRGMQRISLDGNQTVPRPLATGEHLQVRRIVPGRFRVGTTCTDLLIYATTTGFPGSFSLNEASQLPTLPVNQATARHYTSIKGVGTFYRNDGAGNLQQLAQDTGWRRTWHSVVAFNPPGSATSRILFYDRIPDAVG